jgi:hypothetical protein
MQESAESRRKTRFGIVGGVAALLGLALAFALPRWRAVPDRASASSVGAAVLSGARGPSPATASLRQRIGSENLNKISKDPRSPAYDPFKLALLGTNTNDLYESEPRSEPWATAVESLLRTLAEERLKNVAGARLVAVDCRTSACAIKAEAPADQEIELQLEMQAAPYGQYETYNAEDTEDGMFRFGIVGLIGASRRDPAVLAEHLEKIRRRAEDKKTQRLEKIKALREERARNKPSRRS